jgi:hypothetical protein
LRQLHYQRRSIRIRQLRARWHFSRHHSRNRAKIDFAISILAAEVYAALRRRKLHAMALPAMLRD